MRRFIRLARLRYTWQDNAIEVIVGEEPVDETAFARLVARFHQVHEIEFHHSNVDEPVELASIAVEGLGVLPRPSLGKTDGALGAQPAPKSERPVFFRATGWVDTRVYERGRLSPGAVLSGPAVLEEREATTLVPPNAIARVDEWSNLVLTIEPEQST